MIGVSHNYAGVAGYGQTLRVYWKNLQMDGSTAILTGANYLRAGDVVCWSPNLTDPDGRKGYCVGRPETRNLALYAGVVTEVPVTAFGSTGSALKYREGWVLILPKTTGFYKAASRADLSAAATTTVQLVITDGSFALTAAAAMSANAAGAVLTQAIVAKAVSNGTNSSAANEASRLPDDVVLSGAVGL